MKNQNNTQAELQSQIDSLNGDIYDNLTLHSSHLEMLFKMVRTAIDDLTNDNAPHHAISQAKQSLLIAQYLIDEFDYCIQSMIEAHPLYKAEGKVWIKPTITAVKIRGFMPFISLSGADVPATTQNATSAKLKPLARGNNE